MNAQALAYGLFAAIALAFGARAGAETFIFTFDANDLVTEPWVSPFDETEEPPGFRLAGPDGFSLTAFGASPSAWQDTTFVLGFPAAPYSDYGIDWAASWLDVAGTRVGLADYAPAPASETGEAWLAAHAWGGNGLSPETTWVFTVPDADTFSIGGGQIAYYVTSVPEAGVLTMLLAGLGLIGGAAGRARD